MVLAVLRYEEMSKFLIHKSLSQGSHAWPELNGVETGLFSDWWKNTILVTEGQDPPALAAAGKPGVFPQDGQGFDGKLRTHYQRIDRWLHR